MTHNRKARSSRDGRDLARWLNKEPAGPVARVIRFHVTSASFDAVRRRDTLRETFEFAARKGFPIPTEDPSRGFWLPIKLRGEFRLKDGWLDFQVVSDSEADWALDAYGKLITSRDADRLRCCPNCGKFWYCAGRLDNRFCCVKCRVGFWQKTPTGKKRRAVYMRKHRADLRRQEQRLELKGGHIKASKSVLRSLEK